MPEQPPYRPVAWGVGLLLVNVLPSICLHAAGATVPIWICVLVVANLCCFVVVKADSPFTPASPRGYVGLPENRAWRNATDPGNAVRNRHSAPPLSTPSAQAHEHEVGGRAGPQGRSERHDAVALLDL